MGRDRGRGKGGGRGSGKKMFIANVEELALREQVVNEREENRVRRRGEDDEDESGEEEEEVAEKGGDTATNETVFVMERKSRAELEAEKAAARAAAATSSAKAGAEEDDEDEDAPRGLLKSASNPNRATKMTPKMLKVKDLSNVEATNHEEGLSRKEREAAAAQKAKDDYMRRHLAGETEQARADLARLALIKKKREDAAKQREAEGRAPGWTQTGVASDDDDDSSDDDDEDKPPTKGPAAPKAVAAPAPAARAAPEPAATALAAKKKAAAAAPADDTPAAADGGPPKMKAMDIKKLNGDAMKDALKARNLSTQGAKKDLMQRLLDYEASRP